MKTASIYALWSVAAVPLLLSFTTLGSGMHALASVWPFVVLAAMAGPLVTPRDFAVVGASLALALCWSFDSVVLAPVMGIVILHAAWKLGTWRLCLAAISGFAVPALPMLTLLAIGDRGFHLERPGVVWLRGLEPVSLTLTEWLTRLRLTATNSLPGASLLPDLVWTADSTRGAWGMAVFAGLTLALTSSRPRRAVLIGAAILLAFCMAYAGSPVWEGARDSPSHVYYRHLAYVLPIAVALAIHGCVAGPATGRLVAAGLLAFSVAGAAVSWPDSRVAQYQWRSAGWVLGRKLGHDPERIARLTARLQGRDREELALGVGWGTAATVLGQRGGRVDEHRNTLARLVAQYPEELGRTVATGMAQAFSPGVTPVLDPALKSALDLVSADRQH